METDLAYPLGRFEMPVSIDAVARNLYVRQIEDAPRALRSAVEGLNPAQLDTPYRPSGWTVRQVVHHLPDSHVNAYVRFKLALTELDPVIRQYDEGKWASLPDAAKGDVRLSLDLFDALHARWVNCIRELPASSFERTYQHPEMGTVSLNQQLALYAWHGRHHVAHITRLTERKNWASSRRPGPDSTATPS